MCKTSEYSEGRDESYFHYFEMPSVGLLLVRIDEMRVQHIKSSIFVDSNAIIQESQGVYWYTFFRGIYLFDHPDCS